MGWIWLGAIVIMVLVSMIIHYTGIANKDNDRQRGE